MADPEDGQGGCIWYERESAHVVDHGVDFNAHLLFHRRRRRHKLRQFESESDAVDGAGKILCQLIQLCSACRSEPEEGLVSPFVTTTTTHDTHHTTTTMAPRVSVRRHGYPTHAAGGRE